MSKLSNYQRHVQATKILTAALGKRGIKHNVTHTSAGRMINTATSVFTIGVRQDSVVEVLARIDGTTYTVLATDDTLPAALAALLG